MEPLGGAIRHRRGELCLTQEELADRMVELGDENIRQSDISRIESGQVQLPRYERLIYLAQALELTVAELFSMASEDEASWLAAQAQNNHERAEGTG